MAFERTGDAPISLRINGRLSAGRVTKDKLSASRRLIQLILTAAAPSGAVMVPRTICEYIKHDSSKTLQTVNVAGTALQHKILNKLGSSIDSALRLSKEYDSREAMPCRHYVNICVDKFLDQSDYDRFNSLGEVKTLLLHLTVQNIRIL
ncbi:hypothetical protein EVAR_25119_1 [Eumeta japonica]|uniref:Uncharacterized protein n=1 Tax=Eumeta variegata TaxID=151549 RepID=A0A4C1XKK5_EUMVA|nr:hypothetical protein EVAR_25119_1 [Eumeta japonica]